MTSAARRTWISERVAAYYHWAAFRSLGYRKVRRLAEDDFDREARPAPAGMKWVVYGCQNARSNETCRFGDYCADCWTPVLVSKESQA